VTWYKCHLVGENFPGRRFGMAGLAGFHAMRAVEADSLAQVEQRVLALMARDPMLVPPSPVQGEVAAQLRFEQVTRVSEQEGRASSNAGFTVFPMDRGGS